MAVMTGAAVFASRVQAEVLPQSFEDMTNIVCVDREMAIELATIYVEHAALGEKLLAHLATQSVCERTTFSGKPVADIFSGKEHATGKLHEMHVFEVDVTNSEIFTGQNRVYMLLYIIHDNEV